MAAPVTTTRIGDVTFDITTVVTDPNIAGYDKAARDALTDDTLIKVRKGGDQN